MEISQELLDKYYANQCSPSERAVVEKWLTEDISLTELPRELDIQTLEDQRWQHLSRKIAVSSKHPPKKKQWLWLPAAACILFVLAGMLYFSQEQAEPKPTTVPYAIISTKPGQKANLKLPDGTTVHLNSASKLRYPKNFEENKRQVYLTGEAYFSVATDTKRPFTVFSSKTVTQILGTSFNLKAYPDEEETTILVTAGKVNFRSKHNSKMLLLQANQLAQYSQNKLSRTDRVSPEDLIAWRNDQLIFRNETLSAIFRNLERWYGVSVHVQDALVLEKRYTGRFQRARLQQVLKSIGFALSFEYTINNKHVIIHTSP